MQKEVISEKQGISLIILFIIGTSVVIISGLDAGKDLWLANIIAILLALPVVLVFARLHYLFPGKDLFGILQICMGKILGNLIGLLYTWFAFHLSSLIVRDIGEFFITVAAPESPMIVPMIAVSLLGAWVLLAGIEVLGRWTEYFLPIILALLVITILLLVPEMSINNLLPPLQKGIKPVVSGALSAFSFPFGETVMFAFVFSSFRSKKSPYKVYMWGLLLGGAVVLVNSLVNLLVLGVETAYSLYFPFYMAFSRINIKDFLQRLEIVITFVFLLGGFVKMSICLLAACKGITSFLGYKDYRFIVVPMSLLLINFSFLIFDSIMDFLEWSMKV